MAQRLKTIYVQTFLLLSEAQMSKFVNLFEDHGVITKVNVLDGGSQEIVLTGEGQESIYLMFERVTDSYVCQGSCRLSTPKLTNLMRKAIADFKGNAIVHRIYAGFTMIYQYERGEVVKIVEARDHRETLVYEQKTNPHRLDELERLYQRDDVEREISRLNQEINLLLDLKNEICDPDFERHIDTKLSNLSHRLFVLEATEGKKGLHLS